MGDAQGKGVLGEWRCLGTGACSGIGDAQGCGKLRRRMLHRQMPRTGGCSGTGDAWGGGMLRDEGCSGQGNSCSTEMLRASDAHVKCPRDADKQGAGPCQYTPHAHVDFLGADTALAVHCPAFPTLQRRCVQSPGAAGAAAGKPACWGGFLFCLLTQERKSGRMGCVGRLGTQLSPCSGLGPPAGHPPAEGPRKSSHPSRRRRPEDFAAGRWSC